MVSMKITKESNTLVNFSNIYIKKITKLKLVDLKVLSKESYDDVIVRLMDRRDWDVVNGQIITKDTMV